MAALPLSACLSTIDGAPQERLLEPLAQAKAATLCAGQTPVGATPWQSDRKGVVQVDIDTSACGLSGDALYFTSLGGHGQQWVSRGASSIQRPTPSGFRLLVVHPQAEQVAKREDWHVNWMARPRGLTTSELCTGRTGPDELRPTEEGGIIFRVDFERCGFDETPVLLTSLGGEQGHALTRGANSVYWADAKRFAVFVQKRDVTHEQALAWGWHINWVAMPEANDTGRFCAGKTTAKDTPWKQRGTNGLSVKLATNDCGAPLVFATLAGRHSHWYATGAGSVYGVNDAGFRLNIKRYAATPAFARKKNWHVHWMRATPTIP